MVDGPINPGVHQSLADISGEQVQENSLLNYPRHFWSSLKNGHYRYALTGVSIGAPMGAAIGAAVCLIPGVGWALAPLVIPAFTGAAALMGAEGFGFTGAAAAARASGLAEKHARMLDPTNGNDPLTAIDDKLMHDGNGHHYEFSNDRDKGKFFSMKSGITGGAMGAASGAVLGVGGAISNTALGGAITAAAVHIPGALALGGWLATVPALAALAPFAAPAIVGALIFGGLGMTFGIERKVLKSIANTTDSIINGDTRFIPGPDLGRAQSKESDQDLYQHRQRRQAEISHLEKSYSDRIFWGALSGRFHGFAGVVPGILVGAAVGAAIVGVLALTGGGAAAALPFIGPLLHAAFIIPSFAAAGGMYGGQVLSESGTEAGAEATARAIDSEFERNHILRAQGITPPAPKEAESNWLSPRTALVAGAVGAAAGAALTPIIGPGVVGVIPALSSLSTAAMVGISSLIGGGVGASYGLGNKTLKAMTAPAHWVYDKAYLGRSNSEPQIAQVPPQASSPQQAPKVDAITTEEAAKLNERLAAGSGKSFTQMAQQLQPAASAALGA